VLRYAVFRMPAIWDVAASSLIVREAGGECYRWRAGRWEPLTHFEAMPDSRGGSDRHPRHWRAPVLLGGRQVAAFAAARLRPRMSLRARAVETVRRLLGRR
jgi:hypothetical protein